MIHEMIMEIGLFSQHVTIKALLWLFTVVVGLKTAKDCHNILHTYLFGKV